MTASNGDAVTPPEATLADVEAAEKAERRRLQDEMDLRALVRECVHLVGAMRVDLGVHIELAQESDKRTRTIDEKLDSQQETLDALTVSVARVRAEQSRQAQRLGVVDDTAKKAAAEVQRVERRASQPNLQAPDFAGLVYEGEITKVRRERAELAEIERVRAERHQRNADIWRGVKHVGRALAGAGVVAAAVGAILKGCM